MKILYIGARRMGYECLKFVLHDYSNQLLAVYTIDESLGPKTAGHKPFDKLMAGKKTQFHKVKDINAPEIVQQIKEHEPDLILQVAWSQILKDSILQLPKFGCVGFHASLLPKYRGGSPVNWGLINGEGEWGITFFYLEPGIDHGDVISQKKFDLTIEDTCDTVYEKCTKAAVKILEENLPKIQASAALRIKQDDSKATMFKRRKPEQGIIDWNKTTMPLYNWVRALTHPYPGAFTFCKGNKVFIWKAKFAEWKGHEKPGSILKVSSDGALVKTADGALLLQSLQEDGKEEIGAAKYPFKLAEMLG